MMTMSMSIVMMMVQRFVYNKLHRFYSEQMFVAHTWSAVVELSFLPLPLKALMIMMMMTMMSMMMMMMSALFTD